MSLVAYAQPNQIILFEGKDQVSGTTKIMTYLDGEQIDWQLLEYRILEANNLEIAYNADTFYFSEITADESTAKIRVRYGEQFDDILIIVFRIKDYSGQWLEGDNTLYTDKKVGIGGDPDTGNFKVFGDSVVTGLLTTSDLRINGNFKFYDREGFLYANEEGDVSTIDVYSKEYIIAQLQYFNGINSGVFKRYAKKIFEDFSVLNPILWWKIENAYGVLLEKDLRFETLSALYTYVNNVVLAGKLTGYLKQSDEFYNQKFKAYNNYLSRLKGRGIYTKRIGNLLYRDATYDTTLTDNTIEAIYDHFIGYCPTITDAIRSTIGIVANINMYSLPPTKHSIGTWKLKFDTVQATKAFKESTEDVVERNSVDAFFHYDSVVLTAANYGETVSNLGMNLSKNELKNMSRSLIRVYHFVDNLSNPDIHYFYIKPIGVDTYIVAYDNRFNSSNISLFSAIKYETKGMYLKKVNLTPDNLMLCNTKFRVEAEETNFLYNRSSAVYDAKNTRFKFAFFMADTETGKCSPFTPFIEQRVNVAGAKKLFMYKQ